MQETRTGPLDQSRDDLNAGLGATVLRQRLKCTGHDQSEVARKPIGCLRVREGPQFGRDSSNDEVGEPLIKRAGKQRFA
jgi:hypothetical protein